MAFTIHTNTLAPTTADSSTSGTTLAFSPTAAVPVDKLAVLPTVWDNVDTDNADDTTNLSVTDSKDNAWFRAGECQYSAGVLTDGLLVGIFYSVIRVQIETTDTITITSAAAVTAKSATLATFNRDTGKAIYVAGRGYERVAAATAYSAGVSGLASEEHLWVGINGMEADPGNVNDQDSTFTLIMQGVESNLGVALGGTQGLTARTAYKIATDTAETYDRASLGSADRATALVAFNEAFPLDQGFPTRRTMVA